MPDVEEVEEKVEPKPADPVLAAILEMRKDVCEHLHKMQEDVGLLSGRMGSCEAEIKEIKAETKGISARLDETRTTVRETSNHDLEHEKKVSEELLAADRKRNDLEEDVRTIKLEIKNHREETVSIKTDLAIVKGETVLQTKTLATIAEASSEAIGAGKKIASNPVVRVIATALLATGGTWAAAHQTGCGTRPTTTTVAASTDLTPYERDVAACGQSFGCEESVRARYGRAMSIAIGDAGR